MKVIEEVKAIDGYTYLLIEDSPRFGVVCGCTKDEFENPEWDIEPEWFDSKEKAVEFRNKELKFWNSCC